MPRCGVGGGLSAAAIRAGDRGEHDPGYPYVGKYVTNLTLRQVRTLDCGSQTKPQYPQQRAVPGARMPLLSEVFALVEGYDAQRPHQVGGGGREAGQAGLRPGSRSGITNEARVDTGASGVVTAGTTRKSARSSLGVTRVRT